MDNKILFLAIGFVIGMIVTVIMMCIIPTYPSAKAYTKGVQDSKRGTVDLVITTTWEDGNTTTDTTYIYKP